MFFSVLAMIVSAFYTVRNLLYYEQLNLIKETLRPSVLLNIEIEAESGALNAQDNLSVSLNQLKVAQSFFQITIDQSVDIPVSALTASQGDDRGNFLNYLELHGSETQQSFDQDLRIGESQVFYTDPLVTASNIETRRTEE